MAVGCLGILVLLALAGCLSFWLYFHSRDQQALRDIQDEVERIHAAGEPITPEDMAQVHRVPEGESDSTELWLKAARLAKSVESMEKLLLESGEPPGDTIDGRDSGNVWQAIDQFLAENHAAVAAGLVAADAGGVVRFPMNWERGISDRLEHVEGLVRLARIFALRHRVAVARGRWEEASQSLEVMLAIARSAEREAIVVGQLVRNKVLHDYFTELTTGLVKRNDTDAQLEAIQKTLSRLDFHDGLKLSLLGDRVCGFVAFKDPSTLRDNLKNADSLPRGIDSALGRPADCRFYLQTMRDLIEAADLPLAEGRLRALKIKADTDSVVYEGPIWQRMYKRFSAELVGALPFVFNGFAGIQSRRDCAVCILALRRHHLKYRKLPENLDALVPEFLPAVPRDLLANDGAPLRFVVAGGVVTVYSVGLDGVDDLGNEVESDAMQGDIALVLRIGDSKEEH
jgi:hypothetical protein